MTDIPNPAESLIKVETHVRNLVKQDWVTKEYLSKELQPSSDLKESITRWVNEEPIFNLDNWLSFESYDFHPQDSDNRKWTAIYNHTALHDARQYCYARIDFKACLVKVEDLPALKNIIFNDPYSLHFIAHLDRFHSAPETDSYSNPTDIAWMSR